MSTKAIPKRPSRARRNLRRFLRRVGFFITLFLIAVVVFSLCSRPIELRYSPTPEALRHQTQVSGVANYERDEVDTFYTYPEWYIVWSYQAKADFQLNHLPSGYSYFGDIGQFWQAYSRVYAATRRSYPFATADHIMLATIGSSLTVEYALKGLYEETVGRVSEWTSRGQMTAEDQYAASVAEHYAAFVHVRPFYEFSFAHALGGLWKDTPFRATHLLRTVERRVWLSLDYAVESAYCEVIGLATHASYGIEDVNTAAWIEFPADAKARLLASVRSMKIAKDMGRDEASRMAFQRALAEEEVPASTSKKQHVRKSIVNQHERRPRRFSHEPSVATRWEAAVAIGDALASAQSIATRECRWVLPL